MIKGLEAFDALGSTFLMKCKDYRNNSCMILNTDTGKMYSPQELTEIVRKELKTSNVFRELKFFDVRTDNENGKMIYLLVWNAVAICKISKEQYDLLKEALL